MSKENKITLAKGRPMLRWVGKQPLDYVKGFPAQLVEVFDPLNSGQKSDTPTYDALKDNWRNLLFHGDNKEVMATLIENGFRGKVDLTYIDPPFMSGADYVRKVELRGLTNLGRIEEDEASLLQQTMYFDIWNNDAYLQFMYERLMLLKELLSETGSIYVHLDWHVGHYVKLLMDEVFGQQNFVNEVIWNHQILGQSHSLTFPKSHEIILRYGKGESFVFNIEDPSVRIPFSESILKSIRKDAKGYYYKRGRATRRVTEEERRRGAFTKTYIDISKGRLVGDVWSDIPYYQPKQSEKVGFVTQKPEAILNRIIKASTKEPQQALEDGEDIPLVLDCFIGSGTTAAMAQKLGRRWIACDINKGAVQMTSKRLQKIILDQIKKDNKAKQQELPRYYSFGVYQVNNYDLQLLKTEAVELATQHIGIQRLRTDTFFDGTLGKSLVKIIDFNHPLTLLDLQLIQDELRKRPNEDRDITIVCLGKELAVDPQIEEWNKKHPVNKIKVIELKTDKKYGHFLIHKPAEAKITFQKIGRNKAVVEIDDFISPIIIERLNIDNALFKVKIPDFRCMIDTVLIDTNYDGKTFHIIYSDVPEKKDDLVKGKYEIELPNPHAKVAIKIIDMLGEEVLLEVAK
jgi:DNA modification methylase